MKEKKIVAEAASGKVLSFVFGFVLPASTNKAYHPLNRGIITSVVVVRSYTCTRVMFVPSVITWPDARNYLLFYL